MDEPMKAEQAVAVVKALAETAWIQGLSDARALNEALNVIDGLAVQVEQLQRENEALRQPIGKTGV